MAHGPDCRCLEGKEAPAKVYEQFGDIAQMSVNGPSVGKAPLNALVREANDRLENIGNRLASILSHDVKGNPELTSSAPLAWEVDSLMSNVSYLESLVEEVCLTVGGLK